ncbi:MAG: DegV family protein [Acidimicrobiales bacterium]|jgi:DegV family protein with EDD domain
MPEEVAADDRARSFEGDAQSAPTRPTAKIRVVTDSAADLDRTVAGEHGVSIVHLDVRLGAFGPDVTSTWSPEEFWQNSANVAGLPETSAPSPGAFSAAFSSLADDGAEGIVCIALSSKLSATYQAAVVGAESVADGIRVQVVDSRFATMAEGLIVLSAVAAAEAGGDLDDVTAAAVATRGSMQLFGALDSLDNLRKGGRLGSAQALLGGLLDIKPVLEINDGVLELESRPRTRSRSFERLVSKLREAGDIERLAIVHAAASDIDVFVELVASSLAKDRISVGWLGPVIGTHVGRGTVALAVQRRVS